MLIVADENIPYAREAFGTLGEVRTAPGRSLTPSDVAGAEALIVRSVTKVNADLLEGSKVRFVGTCTIGEDHIDNDYLTSKSIGFSSAPGCNANSVAEYIMAALLELAPGRDALQGKRLGIVGVGNVGGKVYQKAQALGLACVLNDPPLADQTGDAKYQPLEAVLECDFITLHVPLNKGGKYPTHHLANADFFKAMQPHAVLLNTSRGAVADNAALKAALDANTISGAVLDVWENEPEIDAGLLREVEIGSPHIAGYSFDGKVNGTLQVYRALCDFLNEPVQWRPEGHLPPAECADLVLDEQEANPLRAAVRRIYDIREDDAALRKLSSLPPEERGAYFDMLRRQYPRRREFQNTTVHLRRENAQLAAALQGIGFQVTQREEEATACSST